MPDVAHMLMDRAKRTAAMILCSLVLPGLQMAHAVEPISNPEIKALVASFKKDPRGPYQGIRWFCPDGTIRDAQEMCPGGHQHALVKEAVNRLGSEKGIYLGQILVDTPFDALWDSLRSGSRLKQYQVEKYLRGVDDGWIMRKARFYRGALQAEDEEAWGKGFLLWALSDADRLSSQFYLLRQACADIPHGVGDARLPRIRALARAAGDSILSFMPLRIKIHSQPDEGDRDSVRSFIARTQMGPTVSALMTDLEAQLTRMYEIPSAEILAGLSTGMNVDSLSRSLGEAERKQEFDAICRIGADILLYLREGAPECDPAKRLQLMDLSLAVEGSIFRAMGGWKVRTPEAMMAKARVLIQAAAGCGYLELWEFQRLSALIETPTGTEPLATFAEKVTRVGRVVNWGAGSVRAIYEPTVAVFAPFEPLASGFVDDRVRGSLLLGVGDVARQLAESLAYLSGNGNQIMGLRLGKGARGLNPGFARGELVVIKGAAGEVDFDGRKIYVVQQAPAEMKPVAGIATVSEGNAVSHVQLLARNLGIPNAVMTADLVTDLGPFSGKDVFYAVSPGGVVVMKLASDMTDDEKALFDTRRVLDERIAVPTDRMNLSDVDLPSLMEVRAVDSGVICGPKAANLGELRSLFPAQVAPGMVIPFAVFRAHMDQKMPDQTQTYWGFLQETFSRINRQSDLRSIDPAVEAEVLVRLSHLRESIKKMPLLPWFSDGLSKQFFSVFGDSLGGVAVFVRSDTNMEDLKDFTGAGLNLTVPNTKDRDILLQAIRDVWSSPFTERSYRWRQKFLRNPEQIYPSILLLKSVPVEKSGVMITSGVGGGDPEDVTVAFSRGVGGAVEGQAAETYLLKASGHDILLAPAREARFSVLPQTGGLARVATSFEKPVLDEFDRLALRLMAKEIRDKLSGMSEPFDVELGILNGKVYLFQIRPFVESKRARASVYLNGLDPDIPGDATVDLTARIRVGE